MDRTKQSENFHRQPVGDIAQGGTGRFWSNPEFRRDGIDRVFVGVLLLGILG